MHRLTIPIIFTALLIGLVTPGGALAQPAPRTVGVTAAVDGGRARDELVFKGPKGGDEPQAPDADQPASFIAPPSPIRQFQTRFDVVDAPAHFDQVLQIVDFPAGTWTPPHTPGGYVYTTVIHGAISTRLSWTGGVNEATYEAGDTFVAAPGEYMQVGNGTRVEYALVPCV